MSDTKGSSETQRHSDTQTRSDTPEPSSTQGRRGHRKTRRKMGSETRPARRTATGQGARQPAGRQRPRQASGGGATAVTGVPGIDLPLYEREEFDIMLAELAARHAPRRFAVVQEYGDRLDGRVAAWGVGFEDHAEVISVDGEHWMRLSAAEHAPTHFAPTPKINASVVWLDPPKTEQL